MILCKKYPPLTRGTLVVWGLLAAFPFPGMTWHRLQYLAGLRRFGFDVWYVEDSDRPVLDTTTYGPTNKYLPNVEYLAYHIALIGLGDRWVFRPPGQYKECLGALDFSGLMALYQDADAVINHSGAQELLPHHSDIKCLVYIETDPVANQVYVANGEPWIIGELSAHNHLFTFAANLGASDCAVPFERFNWIPTRPAICVDWWHTNNPPDTSAALTTIATWKHSGKDVTWQGNVWRWSKHYEFLRFLDLPSKASLPLEIAIEGINDTELERLHLHGWRTIPAKSISTIRSYRKYIQRSRGEFTVAKEAVVAPRPGCFSDRSASYLAAGRPVITQDTGFGCDLPVGEGLFAFSTEEEAIAAIDAVASDFDRHAAAALDIAREFFAADRVIRDAFGKIGLI